MPSTATINGVLGGSHVILTGRKQTRNKPYAQRVTQKRPYRLMTLVISIFASP